MPFPGAALCFLIQVLSVEDIPLLFSIDAYYFQIQEYHHPFDGAGAVGGPVHYL